MDRGPVPSFTVRLEASPGFQRILDSNPDVIAQMNDVTAQLRHLTVLTQDYAEGIFDDNTAKMDELKRLMQTLESQKDMVVREGPVFSFPRANRVIGFKDRALDLSLTGRLKTQREFVETFFRRAGLAPVELP